MEKGLTQLLKQQIVSEEGYPSWDEPQVRLLEKPLTNGPRNEIVELGNIKDYLHFCGVKKHWDWCQSKDRLESGFLLPLCIRTYKQQTGAEIPLDDLKKTLETYVKDKSMKAFETLRAEVRAEYTIK